MRLGKAAPKLLPPLVALPPQSLVQPISVDELGVLDSLLDRHANAPLVVEQLKRPPRQLQVFALPIAPHIWRLGSIKCAAAQDLLQTAVGHARPFAGHRQELEQRSVEGCAAAWRKVPHIAPCRILLEPRLGTGWER